MEPPNRTLKPLHAPMLPTEIIIDILSRLPVKDLQRIRCVSKQIRSTIDGSDFIHLHLRRSIETNSSLRLILSRIMETYWTIHSLSLESPNDCVVVDHPFKNCYCSPPFCCDTPEAGSCNYVSVIGSCNGLLAVHNCQSGTLLLNPSTKKHRIVPKFCSALNDCCACCSGFGYDADTDDYKLVFILDFDHLQCNKVIVYSLKSNSWRRIKDFPYHFITFTENGAFASGALHWLFERISVADEDEYLDSILGFNLKSEEFYQVPMPPVGDGEYCPCVEVLKECLSLVDMYDHGRTCDVWVMKEYGVKDSWTKLFTLQVDGYFGHMRPLAYSKSGSKVLVKNCASLYWYDLEKQRVESSVEIDIEVGKYKDAIICMDSLVSFDVFLQE